tara:strand:- start:27694 stop:29127 length:1434 start_codon:yes stop_codon:yes gene_type:complete
VLFNSIDFALFLPIVFILYWFVFNRNIKLQNLLIVIASYVFYGSWDWRFLLLILFSTFVDYLVGIALEKEETLKKRRLLLWISIFVNLGFLGFFKYYNFFLDNFTNVFSFFGHKIDASSLSIILPVGISFYTFQTLSYTIDVYRKKMKPTKDFVAFAAFVSFFPQLVAGPIERATNLLPQFVKKREFDYNKACDGLRQILWGLFKKIVIADNCAKYANIIFNNSEVYSGSTLVLGSLFFAFQIYGDYSGYSDIAIGTSRLFGFNLQKNFAFPYFSRNIGEFWRRWHISLSTWFRDYLYIPLGGSKVGKVRVVRNIFVIFIVSGFWHGANWNFIIWGALNALYFLPLLFRSKNRKYMDVVAINSNLPSFKELIQMAMTFGFTLVAWIFFRSDTVSQAIQILSEIFSMSLFGMPSFKKPIIIWVLIFMFIEWVGRDSEYAIEKLGKNWHESLRWGFYYIIVISIFLMGSEGEEFIYFQF